MSWNATSVGEEQTPAGCPPRLLGQGMVDARAPSMAPPAAYSPDGATDVFVAAPPVGLEEGNGGDAHIAAVGGQSERHRWKRGQTSRTAYLERKDPRRAGVELIEELAVAADGHIDRDSPSPERCDRVS